METKKKKDLKEIWLSKIETKETALKIIKECSYGFYFIAGLNTIASVFLGVAYIIDAVIFAGLAFLLWKLRGIIIASIALIVSSIVVVTTAINSFTHAKGGGNMFLAIILAWISVRAIQATLKLRKS